MLGAFCLTEPQAGSDASSLRTTARKDGDGYVIDGVKQFITSGKNGQVAIVIAVTDKGAGKRGMSAFIVPTDAPGYTVARLEDKLGQHSSDTAQINFDGCRIPAENLIGQEGEGYKIALGALEGGRIGIAAQSVGMARSAFEVALAYAKERQAFGGSHLRPAGGGLPPGRMRDAARGGAPVDLACGQPARCRPALPQGSRDGQAVRQRDGRARLQRRDPDAGRLRLRQRFSARAHLPRRARVPDLRRHFGHPETADPARAWPEAIVRASAQYALELPFATPLLMSASPSSSARVPCPCGRRDRRELPLAYAQCCGRYMRRFRRTRRHPTPNR